MGSIPIYSTNRGFDSQRVLKSNVMSRTRRKDKEGNVFWDGRRTREINHRCRCAWCTGIDKKTLEEKIADKDMELQLKRWYGDEQYQEEWWELTSSEWERRDKEFIQEQLNWIEYRNIA